MKHGIQALAVGTFVLLAGCVGDASRTPAGELVLESVPLVNHVQFGVFEMDAFIDKGDGRGVYRPSVADAANPAFADAVLYRTATPVDHDPSFTKAGPFAKGEATSVKLKDWLAGRGAVAYGCEGGKATVDAKFTGLVPDGVYTMWAARLTMVSGAITAADDKPMGSADGSQNTFYANAKGEARYRVTGIACVEPTSIDASGSGVATVFAAAWHSDGKTHGPTPGKFGSDTHVQLFAIAEAVKAPTEA